MSENILDEWENDFRSAAIADDFSIFRDHLRRLDLPESHQLMLEGTILVVRMCSAYATVDSRNEQFAEFLAMQSYDPAKAKARYAYTFDIFGKAFARVLVNTMEGTLDLADLYGSPWNDYQVVGFKHLWVSHPDWSCLSKKEVKMLECAISEDLRYDYADDELDFWFDDSVDETYLFVTVQDVV